MKLFVAAGPEAIQHGQKQNLFAAGCLLDSPSNREHAEFEAAWNGYLRIYNLLQFLTNAVFATEEGKASNQPYRRPPTKEKPDVDKASQEEWDEIKDLIGSDFHEILDAFAKSGLAIPEIGFELEDDNGEIIAESELSWPSLKIALLVEAQLDYRDIFKDLGWRIYPIDEVLTNPDSFIRLFD